MTNKPCETLQALLYEQIPLYRALQFSVSRWENHQISLHIPLEPNINHMHSAFGGSLYCGAVLAGWSWLYLRLKEMGLAEENMHIMIHGGTIEYPHPVLGEAVAVCSAPEEQSWSKFITIFKRRKKARLTLTSSIHYDGKLAVYFTGQFVVHVNPA